MRPRSQDDCHLIMSGPENPYQSPSVDGVGVPDAPPDWGWEIAGGKVKVGLSAQLPMVDPFTGKSGDTMMLQKLKIAYRPRWLWAFLILGSFAGLVSDVIATTGGIGPYTISGAICGWILSLVVRVALPLCQLEFFVEKETQRRRLRVGWSLTLLLLITVASTMMNRMLPESIQWLPLPLFLIWLLGNLLAHVLQRRLRCQRMEDGQFVITGFHPRAIEALMTEKERAARGPPATNRKSRFGWLLRFREPADW